MTSTEERENWGRLDENYRRLQAIADRNRCHCGASLSVAWGGSYGRNEHILKCRNGHINEGTVREPTLWELWQRGELDNPYIAERFRKKEEKRMAEAGIKDKALTTLEPYQGKLELRRRELSTIVETLWPDAPKAEKVAAVELCYEYNLSPLMRHVFLIPFENRKTGKTDWSRVLGIGANRVIAGRKGPVSYIDDSPRIMTEEEEEKIRGEVDSENLWAITVVSDPATGAVARGYGSWPKNKEPLGTDKGNTKLNMAMIRSERSALDKLRPGEMPKAVDIIDEAYVPQVTVVDEETGEIEEAQFSEVPEATKEETDQQEGEKDNILVRLGKAAHRVGWTQKKVDDWLRGKVKYLKPWHELTEEQQEEAIEDLGKMAQPLEEK